MSGLVDGPAAATRRVGKTHDTYRKGSGPGVVLVHEIPGITRGSSPSSASGWGRAGAPPGGRHGRIDP